MSRLFIIEGVDSTGKSTLARTLALELQAVYLHSSGHRDLHPAMFAYHGDMLKLAEINLHMGHDVVMDRHWPSELAYATVLRPEMVSQYDFEEMQSRVFRLRGTYIWCCNPNYVTYEQSHIGHDPAAFHQQTSGQYYTIHSQYQEIFRRVEHMTYDIMTDGQDLEKYIASIT